MKKCQIAICLLAVAIILYKEGGIDAHAYQTVSPERGTMKDGENAGEMTVKVDELVFGHASQKDIIKIGKMQGIKKLSVNISEEDIDLSPLSNLGELEELSLGLRWGIEPDTAPLVKLGNLKVITLFDCDMDLSFLSQMHNLEEVVVLRSEVADLSVFRGLGKLEKLSVEYVSDTDLSCLENLTGLESLRITGYRMENMESMGKLTKLKELHLEEIFSQTEDAERTELDFRILENMKEMQSVSIGHMDVSNVGTLAELEFVRCVILADTGIEDIMPLAGLSSLKELLVLGNRSEKVKMQAEFFPEGTEITVMEEVPAAF